jgi:xylan 1,4-beta-xylosidase
MIIYFKEQGGNMKTNNFNAHHSPIGAFSSLTLGYNGKKGGLGLELGGPANQNFYVGLQKDATTYYALPFFEALASEADRYDVEKKEEEKHEAERTKLQIYPYTQIERDFQLCTDTFKAEDLSFTIYNQVTSIPDPELHLEEVMKKVIVPSVWMELTIDNTHSSSSRRAFIGYTGNDPYYGMRHFENAPMNMVGIGQGCLTAIATLDQDVFSTTGFTMEMALAHTTKANQNFFLGSAAALVVDVPAGQKKTYCFVASFFRSGIATATLTTQYYYTKYFKTIEDVSLFALNNYKEITQSCKSANTLIQKDTLSQEQQFMLAHSIRSYYGSTQFLISDEKPLWVVNEGEYRMMNTFDLTVDQLFFEMKLNPWTVKNELDLFTKPLPIL